MKLLRARIKNVFSIGDIEVNLLGRGLCLVTGFSIDENDPNGSGKSSLAHKAITWGLWGQTVVGAKADRVIKRGVKGCRVEIDFIGVDGNAYRVIRSRNPNNLELKGFGSANQDNPIADHTGKLEKVTQQRINKLLGRDFQTWVQTDFFGQGRKIAFAELTPANRYKVLEDILPIGELSKWADKTSRFLLDTVAYIAKWNQETMLQESHLNQHESDQVEIEAAKIKWDKHIFQRITEARKEIKEHNANQAEVRMELEELELYQTSLHHNPDGLVAVKLKQRMIMEKVRECEQKCQEANARASEWRAHCLVLQSRACNVEMVCPRCENPLSKNQVKKLNKEQSQIQLEMAKGNTELQKAVDAVTYWSKEMIQRQQAYGELNSQEGEWFAVREEYNHLRQNMEKTKQKLSPAVESQLLRRLHDCHSEGNPHGVALQKVRTLVQQHKLLARQAKEVLTRATGEKAKLEFWKHAFSTTLKIALLEQVCEFLNTKANEFIRQLGNPQIHIKFSTQVEKSKGIKDEFNVQVHVPSGASSYGLLSGGEQALTSFAISAALAALAESQSSGGCGFMVLDEPFTNLGPTNCDRLVTFLQTFVKQKDTAFIISNEDTLKDLIHNRIEVEKHDGTSRLIAD